MPHSPWVTKSGRTGFSRPIVALAAVAALIIVLTLLHRVDDDTSSTVSSSPPTASPAAGCGAGGPDCPNPLLQLCLDDRGDRIDCSGVLADRAPSSSSTSAGEWLLVGAVALAPFALVLGPLGWRAARRTRRRNAAAFAADAGARKAMGFEDAPEPGSAVFALAQAWRRATRSLVREGPPPVWLFEFERPTGLAFDRWPTRSAVFVPETPLPSGSLVPMRERGGASRFRGTFPRSPAGDGVVQAVGPLLDRRRGKVALVIGGGLVELRTVAAPGTEPLTLSALAELALDVVDTIEALDAVDAVDAASAAADAPG